jgi:DNA-directed RNA polymerase specialized sigma24 family protein
MSRETDKLLYHPEVTKIVYAVLRASGMREQLLEDGHHDVCERALCASNRPDTLEGWKKLARKVAKAYGIDKIRERTTVGRTRDHAGPTDKADDHDANAGYRPRWTLHDAKKAIDIVWVMIDAGALPQDFEQFLDAVQAGTPHEEIAKEMGLSPERYRKALWKGRTDIMAALTKAGLGSLAVAGVIFFLVTRLAPTPVAENHVVPMVLPDADTPGPLDEREELPPSIAVDVHKTEADKLRAFIEIDVMNGEWGACVSLYERLDTVYPDAGKVEDPVRKQCEREFARTLNSKSGFGLKPTKPTEK